MDSRHKGSYSLPYCMACVVVVRVVHLVGGFPTQTHIIIVILFSVAVARMYCCRVSGS